MGSLRTLHTEGNMVEERNRKRKLHETLKEAVLKWYEDEIIKRVGLGVATLEELLGIPADVRLINTGLDCGCNTESFEEKERFIQDQIYDLDRTSVIDKLVKCKRIRTYKGNYVSKSAIIGTRKRVLKQLLEHLAHVEKKAKTRLLSAESLFIEEFVNEVSSAEKLVRKIGEGKVRGHIHGGRVNNSYKYRADSSHIHYDNGVFRVSRGSAGACSFGSGPGGDVRIDGSGLSPDIKKQLGIQGRSQYTYLWTK